MSNNHFDLLHYLVILFHVSRHSLRFCQRAGLLSRSLIVLMHGNGVLVVGKQESNGWFAETWACQGKCVTPLTSQEDCNMWQHKTGCQESSKISSGAAAASRLVEKLDYTIN